MSQSIKKRLSALANKRDADELRKLLDSIRSELVLSRALANENKSVINAIRSALSGNYLISNAGLAIGGTTTAVSSLAFTYSIGGASYYKAAVSAGTAPGNDVIPQSKFGAVAFDIGTNGTIDAVEAAANASGYDSAALAIAGIPAPEAGHARIGYVTATKSDGAFTFGTTALNAANTTVAYSSATNFLGAIAALSAVSSTDMSEYLAE